MESALRRLGWRNEGRSAAGLLRGGDAKAFERIVRELRDERIDAPRGKAPDRRLPPPDRR